jgi:hypothetical protein
MINIKWLIIIFFIFVALSTLFSRVYLRNHSKFTSKELAGLHPKLGSINFKYKLFHIVLGAVFFFFFSIAIINTIGKSDIADMGGIFLLSLMCAVFNLSEGIFGLTTGVFPVTTKYDWNQFVYDDSKSLQWIAFAQIGLGIFGILVICIVLLQSYPN